MIKWKTSDWMKKEGFQKNNGSTFSQGDVLPKANANRKRQTLGLSIRDGIAFSILTYFGVSYFSAFAVALGFAASQISYIISLPQFFQSISQLWSQNAISRWGRFRVLLNSVMIQSFSLALFVILGIATGNIYLVILFLSIFYASGGYATNAWGSLIGDIVPEKKRGVYFAHRTKLMSITAVISLIVSGILIYYIQDYIGIYAFVVAFAIAVLARLYSYFLLRKHYDAPHYELDKKEQFGFIRFISKFPKSNFTRFAYFYALLMFAIYVSAAMLSFYKLKVLHASILQYALYNVAFLLGNIATLSLWGKFADRHGNRATLMLAAIFKALVIFMWVLVTDLNLLYFAEFSAGIITAGLNLAALNYIFDAVSSKKRSTIFAYVHILSGFAIMLAGLFASAFIDHFDFISSLLGIHMNSFRFLFTVSGIMRIIIVLAFMKFIHEVRSVQPPDYIHIIGHLFANTRFIGHTSSLLARPLRSTMRELSAIPHEVLKGTKGAAAIITKKKFKGKPEKK